MEEIREAKQELRTKIEKMINALSKDCLLYTSDAADDLYTV